jgi:hypothetical protein
MSYLKAGGKLRLSMAWFYSVAISTTPATMNRIVHSLAQTILVLLRFDYRWHFQTSHLMSSKVTTRFCGPYRLIVSGQPTSTGMPSGQAYLLQFWIEN